MAGNISHGLSATEFLVFFLFPFHVNENPLALHPNNHVELLFLKCEAISLAYDMKTYVHS